MNLKINYNYDTIFFYLLNLLLKLFEIVLIGLMNNFPFEN